ncbi:DUF4405 domain-containing protein [Colwellia sp. UCD-KL20]|uniref:DUF4405 domain-containing protein n=1 Tax=Colwellia sp. UCD-KL20 TaxID=1917165 RepID=UPI0011776740|nr:DUF4405 domain-containing protein [Colwellia sp. UCD-KL20]
MQSKHFNNFGLLISFLTLVVTGVMAYFLPFSLTTTRLHILFAVTTIGFISYHLWQKYSYFFKSLSRASSLTLKVLFLLVCLWVLFLAVGIQNLTPANYIIDLSYEGRHQREVLRMSSYSATEITENKLYTVRAVNPDKMGEVEPNQQAENNTALNIEVRLPNITKTKPAIAIWAESTSGSLIETLYISPELAYTDTPNWHGEEVSRDDILPVWRNKYTLVSGLNPLGEIDATTGATDSHSFSLENYFKSEAGEYVIFLEVNMPFDTNETWQDPHLGQPSVLYSAYIEHGEKTTHAILELTGHSEGKASKGSIQYNFDTITSADELLQLGIVSGHKIKQ